MLLNNASVHSIDNFLTIIIICYHYKVLSSEDYSLLLSAATKDGYSTLHDAIKTNNPVIVGKILRLNLSAVELGIASPDTLYHLLTSRCKGGFNPLQKIYISKNYELMIFYIRTIYEAFNKGFISDEILADGFLNINCGHFSVYFDAIATHQLDFVKNHIAILRLLLKNKLITPQDYKKQLLNPNSHGFNILFGALRSQNPEIIELVLTDLSHLLSNQEIRGLALSMMLRFRIELKLDIMKNQTQVYQVLEVFLKKHLADDLLNGLERPVQNLSFFRTNDGQPRPNLNFAPH